MFSVTNTEVEDLAVVDQERVPDEIGDDHGRTRPGFDRLFDRRSVHLVDLFVEVARDERAFFQ